jgi:hypothetical protein
MTRFAPHWRKATWALAILAALLGAQLVSTVAGSTLSVPSALWFSGFLVLGIVWFASRSNVNALNTQIFGPNGQEWIVSRKTAERRIKSGWTSAPQTQEAVV